MRCPVKEEDFILYYYNELTEEKKSKIDIHLKNCSRCLRQWTELKEMLDTAELKQKDMPESYWDELSSRISYSLKSKPACQSNRQRFMKPAFAVIMLLLILLSGYKWYTGWKEEQFISKNLELLQNIDMFENLDLLEHLDEFDKYI